LTKYCRPAKIKRDRPVLPAVRSGMGFAGFSDRELKVIEWRTHGVKVPEIGRKLGVKRHEAYNIIWRIYRKVGVDDVALLTRWAIENGMDEPLGPEKPEERPMPGMPKLRGNEPIRLGRIRRARIPAECA